MAKSSLISRRRVLKTAGVAAVGGGANALLGGGIGAAQGGAPAILTNAQGGRKFKGFVKYNTRDIPSVQELTVRPLTGRQVLMRTEAAQTCYTSVDQVLIPGTPANQASIVGHGGVGVVEAIGPQVLSCRVGDRAIVNLHAACGRCFNCLRQRSDKCRNGGAANPGATCTMADGTPVFSYTGAMSELMITNEEYVTPLFTDVSAVEIAMLTCVGGCGLGMTMTNAPVEPGSDVVIFGAGPVGLSSVMGAKVKGASRIIVVEPIRYRRELALTLGATDVVDPNQYRDRQLIAGAGANADRYRDSLVEHLREMTRMPTDRLWAGATRRPTVIVGLEVAPDVLEGRIRKRTETMFERGVVDEVRAALSGPVSRTAEKTLGLTEIAELGPDALEPIVARTRRYAAYQRKWMRRIPDLVLLDGTRAPGELADDIVELA